MAGLTPRPADGFLDPQSDLTGMPIEPRWDLIQSRGRYWPTVASRVTIPLMQHGRGHGRSARE